MQATFFQFIMKHVNHSAKDPLSRLANTIHQDPSFPKHTHNFDDISRYMEQSSMYTKLMPIFDEAWTKYQYEA